MDQRGMVIYWADYGGGAIQRSNGPGSSADWASYTVTLASRKSASKHEPPYIRPGTPDGRSART